MKSDRIDENNEIDAENKSLNEIIEIDVKSPEEITDDDVLKINGLHEEFISFLETKAEISPDKGVKAVIPTGIDLLDTVLGGGFPIGVLSIIVGQPGSGKSMLAFQALGAGQRMYKGTLLGAVLDSEEATTTERLWDLGVRAPRVVPYNSITVEKVFQFLEGLCLFKSQKEIVDIPSMVIWDSIANTMSLKEIEASDPNSVIGYKARLLSLLIPKYVSKCSKNNICFIAVNQLRDDVQIGNFVNPKELKFLTQGKTMPGGSILKYNAFHLLEMKTGQVITQDKHGFDGVVVKVKCVKNKLFPPNIEVELIGSFTTGFSNFWTNYKMLVDNKRLNSGAWNYLVSFPEKKFRTRDAEVVYNQEQKFKEAFDNTVKETLQTEYINKYKNK